MPVPAAGRGGPGPGQSLWSQVDGMCPGEQKPGTPACDGRASYGARVRILRMLVS
jgi:cytochrome c5